MHTIGQESPHMENRMSSPLDAQVGGEHYRDLELQPIEIIHKLYGYAGVKAAVHCKIEKYLSRNKESEMRDLRKAAHCLALLIHYKGMEDYDESL